jgi:hypothetical protein
MAKKTKKSLAKAGDKLRAQATALIARAERLQAMANEIDACGDEATYRKLQSFRRMEARMEELRRTLKDVL